MPDQARVILAVVLSMAVFFIYYTWIDPPLPPTQPSQNVARVDGDSTQISPKNLATMPIDQNIPNLNSQPIAPTPIMNKDEKHVIENKRVKGVLSSWGGAVTSWELKDYHVENTKESPLTNLLEKDGQAKALLLTIGDQSHDGHPDYKITKNGNEVLATWSDGSLEVRKYFKFGTEQDDHLVDLTVQILNKGSSDKVLDPRLWVMRSQKVDEEAGFLSFLKGPADLFYPQELINGKFSTDLDWKKLESMVDHRGRAIWTSLSDRYFLLSLISRKTSDDVSIRYGKESPTSIYTSLSYGKTIVHAGQMVEQTYSAYLGAKTRDELFKVGVQLEKSVDYGWFGFMAIPLLWLLTKIHLLVGNWGVAIIVLTFLVKLVLHPVNKKSMLSMKAMQKLQPRLKEIREKFKDDKQKLNTEMMQLFKTHKVNPMGGCLPLIVQMPVYIALYKVLWNAIELYQAPFFWFYTDLSAPDPYFISPILLGIFMVLQQKLTPTAATVDPAQQKVMMIMPVMFSGLLIFFPSGLVIYIFVNTFVSVVQQYMMHQDLTFVGLVKKIGSKIKR